jgi:hypothetical protein
LIKKLVSFIILILVLVFSGCNKQPEIQNRQKNLPDEFSWKDNITIDDIPGFNIRGLVRGKDQNYSYIILEKWHGSNDNVLRFSVNKPSQPCGYIDNFLGVEITRKGKAFEVGDYEKKRFNDNYPDINVRYKADDGKGNIVESSPPFDFAVKIDSVNEKKCYGMVSVCFNDDSKSWVAGKFEADICNN